MIREDICGLKKCDRQSVPFCYSNCGHGQWWVLIKRMVYVTNLGIQPQRKIVLEAFLLLGSREEGSYIMPCICHWLQVQLWLKSEWWCNLLTQHVFSLGVQWANPKLSLFIVSDSPKSHQRVTTSNIYKGAHPMSVFKWRLCPHWGFFSVRFIMLAREGKYLSCSCRQKQNLNPEGFFLTDFLVWYLSNTEEAGIFSPLLCSDIGWIDSERNCPKWGHCLQ